MRSDPTLMRLYLVFWIVTSICEFLVSLTDILLKYYLGELTEQSAVTIFYVYIVLLMLYLVSQYSLDSLVLLTYHRFSKKLSKRAE